MKKLGYPVFGASLLLVLAFLGCVSPVDPGKSTGGIIGKAYFNNAATHEGIAITLEKTDGLRSVSASYAQTSGRIAFNSAGLTAAVTTQDGSYTFTDVPAGTYTLYASSKDSKERAVAVNVTVAANVQITAADLYLTPVGGLQGNITIDNNPTGNTGFLVFIASTSYMAITGDEGDFTLSDVPVGTGYQIVIMKGSYTGVWTSAVSISAGVVTPLGTQNISFVELSSGGLVWKEASTTPPANPQINWAYYNSVDKKSYIYNGNGWQIFAADGAVGPEGPKGDNGANGISLTWKGTFTAHPANPQTNWAYYNSEDKKSYIYNGSGWQTLAVDGAIGPEGPKGNNGANGISLTWKGTFTAHPANPQTNWAYYNSDDKKSYIYDGSRWQTLAVDGQNADPNALPAAKGKLTVNGLGAYNDKYILGAGEAGSKIIVGCNNMTANAGVFISYEFVRITNDKAELPLYYYLTENVNENTIPSLFAYDGNDTITYFLIGIFDDADGLFTEDDDINAENIANKELTSGTFSSGNLTVSW
jgi:hypothetical protein